MLHGRLYCNDSDAALLGAYLLQSLYFILYNMFFEEKKMHM